MQCKDIPELPILMFLAGLNRWGCSFEGFDNSVQNAMPPNMPIKIVLAKMRGMIKKGLVSGCGCGCRGDYEITDKGKEVLRAAQT